MDKWTNVYFESSSSTTLQFASFARDFKKHIKQILEGVGMELVSFNRGHFYICGFAKKDDKYIYFSTDDVRGSDGWLTSVLVRTAKHDRDYTGGSNNFAPLPMVGTIALKLIGAN